MAPRPRAAERKRWRSSVIDHLEDFPRQFAALETAMAAFGEDFDLGPFKEAFNTKEDLEAYNRVQAVERAAGRVQNYVAELADAGVKLADLWRRPPKDDGSQAQQAFEALRDAGVIDSAVCKRLTRAQKAGSRIEHSYVKVPAGDVHRAVTLVHDSARDFTGPYRVWIEDVLKGDATAEA